MTDDAIAEFCAAIRARSAEHTEAMRRNHGLVGQQVAILRQEVDSMVRVIHLLSLDPGSREARLTQFMNGDRWTRPAAKGREAVVSDAEMVELANHLHGWTSSVYRFGCGFIHLSRLSAFRTVDPLASISPEERRNILGHLHRYHGCPDGNDVTFDEIIGLLPAVLAKITGNLDCYLRDLEGGRPLSN